MDFSSLKSAALEQVNGHIDYILALQEAEKVDVGGVEWCLQGATPQEVTKSYVAWAVETAVAEGNSSTSSSFHEVVRMYRRLEAKGLVDVTLCASMLCDSVRKLRLEALVNFMHASILPLSDVLSKDGVSTHFFDQVYSYTLSQSGHSVLKDVVVMVMREALTCTHESEATTQRATAFLAKLNQVCFEGGEWSRDMYTPLHVLQDTPLCSFKTLTNTCSLFLSETLREPKMLVSAVVEEQSGLRFRSLPDNFLCMFSLLVKTMVPQSMFEILKTLLLHQKELNWRNVVMCIECGLQLQPLFQDFMTELLQELVECGVSTCDRDMLCSAVVLARYNGDEQPHERYKIWLTALLEEKVTNRKVLSLLVETLTVLVPMEPLEYLKVHLEKLSRKHDHLLEDYIALVRTRVKDLGGGASSSGRSEAAELLQEALEEFENSSRVLPKVMEASIFRAPFYIGSFLPLLLSPSEEDGVQRGLVEELHRQGKVPMKLYTDYVTACARDEEESSIADEEHWEDLSEIIHACAEGKDLINGKESCELLKACLPASAVERACYNLAEPDLQQWQVEVVDRVFEDVCHECLKREGKSVQWLSRLVRLFAQVEALQWPLLVRLRELLSKQIIKLSELHIKVLSSLVVYLAQSKGTPSLALPLSQPMQTLRSFDQWVMLLTESLPLTDQDSMMATLQFSLHLLSLHQSDFAASSYLAYGTLRSKCVFIFSRWSHSGQHRLSEQLRDTYSRSSLKMEELSYEHWLEWELRIEPEGDLLLKHERVTYVDFMFNHFLHGDLEGQLNVAVSQLFAALLTPALPSYGCGLALLLEALSSVGYEWGKPPLVIAIQHVLCSSPSTHCYGSIVKLLCDVPAWYMLSDAVEQPLTTVHLKSSANCLISIQKLSNRSNSYVLPATLTFHLAKVLGKTSTTSQFFSCSPLYHSSLLVALSKTSQNVAKCHHIPEECWKAAQLLSKSPAAAGSTIPVSVQAVCLFESLPAESEVPWDPQWMETAPLSVVAAFFDCCVCVLAGYVAGNSYATRLFQVAGTCVKLRPRLIFNVQSDVSNNELLSQFRAEFSSSSNLNRLPWIFFRVLLEVPANCLTELCKSGGMLAQLCISHYSQLMQLQFSSYLQCYQGMGFEFLQQCTNLTKEISGVKEFQSKVDSQNQWIVQLLREH